jgi:hypothetical protein
LKIASTYIKSFLIILSVLAAAKLSGQSYTFNPGPVLNMVVDTNENNFDGIEIQNTGSQNLNLSWRLVSVDTLIDSRFELCNSGICFMNLPVSGNMPGIAPGATGWLKFHIISGSATGLNTIKYILKNGTIQKDTLTFNITVANVTGLHEASNSKDKISLYPNPASHISSLSLELTQNENLSISVVNAIGQIVYGESLTNLQAGNHVVNFNTESWASGIYNIKISTNDGTTNRKLVIAK